MSSSSCCGSFHYNLLLRSEKLAGPAQSAAAASWRAYSTLFRRRDLSHFPHLSAIQAAAQAEEESKREEKEKAKQEKDAQREAEQQEAGTPKDPCSM